MQQHPNQPGGFRSHRSPDIHRYPRSGLRCPWDLWFFSNTNGPTTDWAFQYSTIDHHRSDFFFIFLLTLWLNYQKFTDLKIVCGHWDDAPNPNHHHSSDDERSIPIPSARGIAGALNVQGCSLSSWGLPGLRYPNCFNHSVHGDSTMIQPATTNSTTHRGPMGPFFNIYLESESP